MDESGQQLLIMLNEILDDVRTDNLTDTDIKEEKFDLYQFLSSTTAEEALQLAQNNTFDLIITDIGLPGISGNEFTKQFRFLEKAHGNKPIPVIGLTDHA